MHHWQMVGGRFEERLLRTPHEPGGAPDSEEKFPLDIQVASETEILNAIDDHWKIYGRPPTLLSVAAGIEIRGARGIPLGALLESLYRLEDSTRAGILSRVHGNGRRSLDLYVEARRIITELRERRKQTGQAYTLDDFEKAMGRSTNWGRVYVSQLGVLSSQFGFSRARASTVSGSGERKPKEEKNEEVDTVAKIRKAYADTIRSLVTSNTEISSEAMATRARKLHEWLKPSPDAVRLFLEQPENKNFIERAKRGEE